ncbi:hypothetical protein AB0M94_34970 [Streptomyces xanthochromogenes]
MTSSAHIQELDIWAVAGVSDLDGRLRAEDDFDIHINIDFNMA